MMTIGRGNTSRWHARHMPYAARNLRRYAFTITPQATDLPLLPMKSHING
jgi:hypothetical protein